MEESRGKVLLTSIIELMLSSMLNIVLETIYLLKLMQSYSRFMLIITEGHVHFYDHALASKFRCSKLQERYKRCSRKN